MNIYIFYYFQVWNLCLIEYYSIDIIESTYLQCVQYVYVCVCVCVCVCVYMCVINVHTSIEVAKDILISAHEKCKCFRNAVYIF